MINSNLNAVILLVLVDVIEDLYMYVAFPPKNKYLNEVCAKEWK